MTITYLARRALARPCGKCLAMPELIGTIGVDSTGSPIALGAGIPGSTATRLHTTIVCETFSMRAYGFDWTD